MTHNGVSRTIFADIFEALLARIAEYDDVTLDRLATHVSEGGWPFADLFEPRTAARFRASGRLGSCRRRSRSCASARERSLLSRPGRWSRSIYGSCRTVIGRTARSLR